MLNLEVTPGTRINTIKIALWSAESAMNAERTYYASKASSLQPTLYFRRYSIMNVRQRYVYVECERSEINHLHYHTYTMRPELRRFLRDLEQVVVTYNDHLRPKRTILPLP